MGFVPTFTQAQIQLAATQGWSLHVEHLGGWVLRAAGGYTKRANSVLAAGDPGCALDEALEVVEAWYGNHSLSACFQVFDGCPTNRFSLKPGEMRSLRVSKAATPTRVFLQVTTPTGKCPLSLCPHFAGPGIEIDG